MKKEKLTMLTKKQKEILTKTYIEQGLDSFSVFDEMQKKITRLFLPTVVKLAEKYVERADINILANIAAKEIRENDEKNVGKATIKRTKSVVSGELKKSNK